MEQSILKTIKKLLGLDPDYTAFDLDVIVAINSALMAISQIGVGPWNGFSIEDDTATWTDFLGDTTVNFSGVKSYIYLKSRLMFDPPTNSFVVDAMLKQIGELEFRLGVQAETPPVDPATLTTTTTV